MRMLAGKSGVIVVGTEYDDGIKSVREGAVPCVTMSLPLTQRGQERGSGARGGHPCRKSQRCAGQAVPAHR